MLRSFFIMDLRSAARCILVLFLVVIVYFPSVSADTIPGNGAPESAISPEKIAQINILQDTNKAGWNDQQWLNYANQMKSKGSVNEAKEAYYKGYDIMTKSGSRTMDKESDFVSNIAAIETQQGNIQTAREIYDKTCNDNDCGRNWKLMQIKAGWLLQRGEFARSATLSQRAQSIRTADEEASHNGIFDMPLNPSIIILGILGAVLIFCRGTVRKE